MERKLYCRLENSWRSNSAWTFDMDTVLKENGESDGRKWNEW